MPKVSWESAEKVEDIGVGEIREEIVDGYEFSFFDMREEADMGAMLKGLPDDRCTCPHWGYVLSGTLTFEFADHSEAFEAGDAYYVGPGHIPVMSPGTKALMISPEEQVAEVEAVIRRNMEVLQSG
jgi:hypothetical protein